MSREIKFRGWNEYGMLGPFELGSVLAALPHDYIEQYTGLKDKNDKEIYEGDIVMFYKEAFHESSYTLSYEISEYKNGFYLDNELELSMCRAVEIIGNIHEANK